MGQSIEAWGVKCAQYSCGFDVGALLGGWISGVLNFDKPLGVPCSKCGQDIVIAE